MGKRKNDLKRLIRLVESIDATLKAQSRNSRARQSRVHGHPHRVRQGFAIPEAHASTHSLSVPSGGQVPETHAEAASAARA